MNQAHLELLRSEDWRQLLRELILPFAFGDRSHTDLGDDVLEIGPGPGLTTDLLRVDVPSMTSLEIDPGLARELRDRMDGSNVTVVEGDATRMSFKDGRFTGAVSFTMLHHVPTTELQDRLFSETRRALRPGGLFIANDSVASDDLAALHVDDVYNPVDPTTLDRRLADAGFVDVDVLTNEFAWAIHARRPAQ